MLNKDNSHSIFTNNNNSTGINKFKLPIDNINSQSRNYKKALISDKNLGKHSLYSTKEATPRKEYNQVIMPSDVKNTFYKPSKEKHDKNDLDEISQILNNNKKDLNYSGMVGKCPGINEEQNFVYDHILFNKSSINKAKILSHKIGVLKLPISNISSKEALTNSDREKKYFSDRVQGMGNSKQNNNNNNDDDIVGISCCFFGKK